MSDGVHQVLAGAAARDAITIHALAARDVLRDMGLRSEVVCEADHIDPALGGQVRPHTGWDTLAEPGDAAILHYSIASPAFWDVAGRTDRLAIHYHNITPARLLWEFAPGIAIECADGRRRLGELADRVRWAAADSSFNAGELEELGFPPARVVGVMRRPSLPPPGVREDHARTRLLFVGRGVPNKAQHHLVMALAALREGGTDAELRLVGSWAGIEDYRAHCEALAAALGVDGALTITGSVDDQRLADEYAGADLFLCLSDHEGYCVPLVEAMEHDLPIVAYAQGAIPETAGRAGLLLDEKPPSLVAEAVAETLANDRTSRPDGRGPRGATGRPLARARRGARPRVRHGDVVRLLIGATVPADLRAALEPVAARLGAPDLAPVHPDVTAIAGVPDPLVLAEAPGPIVAIPVDEPGRAPAAAVVAHADAIALLDPDDIPTEAGGLPVVVVGLPAPPARGGGVALDHSGVPRAIVEALRVEAMRPELVAQTHGVTWLRGRGAAVLARAAGAWRSGRAAIGLPGVPDAERLRAAGCPRCTSTPAGGRADASAPRRAAARAGARRSRTGRGRRDAECRDRCAGAAGGRRGGDGRAPTGTGVRPG